MIAERYRGIQICLVLPFRFLTPFFALCFRLLRISRLVARRNKEQQRPCRKTKSAAIPACE